MPFTTYSLAGDVADLIGVDYDLASLRVVLHPSDPMISDGATQVRLGSIKATVSAAGTFTIPNIPASAAGAPLYRVEIRWRDASRQDRSTTTGWFAMTGNSNLAVKVTETVEPVAIDPDVAAQIAAAAALGATNDTATASFVNNEASATNVALDGKYANKATETTVATGRLSAATMQEDFAPLGYQGINALTGYVHATAFGPKLLSTVNAAIEWAKTQDKAATIYLDAGTWVADEPFNLNEASPDFDLAVARPIHIKGAGRWATVVTPGNSFGYGEMIGTQNHTISDISFFQADNDYTVMQYGIIGGRTIGNAGTNFFRFENVDVVGKFIAGSGAIFMLNAEVATYENIWVWGKSGSALVLARDMTDHDVDLYWDTPLSTTALYNGGNTCIRVASASLQTSKGPVSGAEWAMDSPLVLENAGRFTGEMIYTTSMGGPSVLMSKGGGGGVTFTGLQNESWLGATDFSHPFGLYFRYDDLSAANDGAGGITPEHCTYRVNVEGGFLAPIYGENGATVSITLSEDSYFYGGASTWAVDVWRLVDSVLPQGGATQRDDEHDLTYRQRDLDLSSPFEIPVFSSGSLVDGRFDYGLRYWTPAGNTASSASHSAIQGQLILKADSHILSEDFPVMAGDVVKVGMWRYSDDPLSCGADLVVVDQFGVVLSTVGSLAVGNSALSTQTFTIPNIPNASSSPVNRKVWARLVIGVGAYPTNPEAVASFTQIRVRAA